ncbi:MAG: tryptophan synthase subunit beta, partial [Aquiluna sp.]
MSQKLGEQVGPYFGEYGGRFVPEPLIAALDQLAEVYEDAKKDEAFQNELADLHRNYTGRPSIITEATRFAAATGGLRVF